MSIITSWRIEVMLENGETVYVSDMPNDVSNVVDEYLSELEAD
tara:strand:- start:188 stop:316 length:129 start_codon:yes stop_codon:yes gene_type:complete